MNDSKIGRINTNQFEGVISNVTLSKFIECPKLNSKRGRFGLRKRSRRIYIELDVEQFDVRSFIKECSEWKVG